MADSVVSFLLENLTQLLSQELKLLGGVEDQVRLLQNELSLIKIFLKNTEGKGHDNELLKEVVSQIRDVTYEAEDVIDTFIITVTKHKRRSKLRRFILSCDRAILFHDVAKRIESIKNVIKEIYDNKSKYGIGEIAESSRGDAEMEEMLHKRRRYVEEVQVVGFGHDSEVLVKQLIEGSLNLNVVSIIGMGGLGKTTLARKIYNNNHVKNHFDCHGWVYVSQEYKIKNLWLEILKGVSPMPKLKKFVLKDELKEELLHRLEAKYSTNKDKLKGTLIEDLNGLKAMNDEECRMALLAFLEPIEDNKLKKSLSGIVEGIYKKNGVGWQDLDDNELKTVLLECLRDKRYLIVMDDIWKTEAWDEVSVAFPTNSNGSRILITSRIKEVASHASRISDSIPLIPPYELPFLEEDKSWELFSKKVFRGDTCPLELETLGREIVKSCHGLPLAIVVLGGLLANKEKTNRTWSRYVGHVNSYLTEDGSSCFDILALSYNQLPQFLKPCFLYFGIYPEDFEIPVRQLIRLWIAEGFIRKIGNRNMEDVAEDYLEELINRSLIQVATKRLDGGVKTCRIHDLLRDLCISESAEEKFLEVRSNDNLSQMSKFRRISIHFANHPYISSNPCLPSNSRSVIGFQGAVGHNNLLDKGYYLKWLCEFIKLVRVVELGNMVNLRCLIPKKIENLVHLRYLSISSGVLHVIPDSICNLWNLETLVLRNSTIEFLPTGIWKLQKLRHLYLDGPTCLPRFDNEAGLPNLQVLTGISLCDGETDSHFVLARFPNLRKLGLCCSDEPESLVLTLSSIHPLRHLQTLKLRKSYWASMFTEFNLQISHVKHTYALFRPYIFQKISKNLEQRFSNLLIKRACLLPYPSSLQSTLTKITLVDLPGLNQSVWNVLVSLTNLRILKVVNCNRFTLHCDESSFCQLEVFKVTKVTDMDWTMEKGAMPRLQRLVLERCGFYMIPLEEICCLTALRDVEVLHPDSESVEMLRQLKMENGCKLQVYPPLDSSLP